MTTEAMSPERARAVAEIVAVLPRCPDEYLISLADGLRKRFDPTWTPELLLRIVRPERDRRRNRPA